MKNTRTYLIATTVLSCRIWLFAVVTVVSGMSVASADEQATTDHEIAYLAFTEGYWQVWAMSREGENKIQISSSPYDKSRISWLGDQEKLLLCGNQGQISLLAVSSGAETPINIGLKGIQDAVASHDGKWLAFSLSTADSIDDNNIWTATIEGTELKKMTNLPALQHDPAWTHDDAQLYFSSGPGGQDHDLWSINLNTKRLEQITIGQRYNFDVTTSKLGDLAFSSNRSGNYELWLKPGSGDLKQITDDDGLDAKPSFSPDAKRLVFESSRSGVLNIWLMDLHSNDIKQLTDHAIGARYPIWRNAPLSISSSRVSE